jgi:hypothetical protein
MMVKGEFKVEGLKIKLKVLALSILFFLRSVWPFWVVNSHLSTLSSISAIYLRGIRYAFNRRVPWEKYGATMGEMPQIP